MNNPDRLKKIEEELKKSSEELFKPKTKDIKAEFEKETVLGSPKNLIKPDKKNE